MIYIKFHENQTVNKKVMNQGVVNYVFLRVGQFIFSRRFFSKIFDRLRVIGPLPAGEVDAAIF